MASDGTAMRLDPIVTIDAAFFWKAAARAFRGAGMRQLRRAAPSAARGLPRLPQLREGRAAAQTGAAG